MRLPISLLWSRAHFDGVRLYNAGDHAHAEAALRRAVALASRMRPRDARLACSLYALARLRQVHGELGLARRLYEHALAVEVAVLGADHPYARMIAEACATVARQIGARGPTKRRCRRRATPSPSTARPDAAARLAVVA